MIIANKKSSSEEVKVKLNLLYTLGYQFLTFVYPLLTTPIVSRVFGPELLGTYAYTYSIAFYFSLFVQLGIGTYGSRLIASTRIYQEKLNKDFLSLYTIQMVSGTIVFFIYIIYSWNAKTYIMARIMQSLLIIAAIIDISWLFTGLEKFKTLVLRNVFVKIISLLCICVFVRRPEDLILYIIIVNGSTLVGQLTIWPTVFKLIKWTQFQLLDIKKHIPDVLRLFLPVLSLNAYAIIDKAMLGFFRSITEVGFYENSEKLVKMPYFLSGAVTAVLLPRASYLISQGKGNENNEYVIKTLQGVLVLALPMAGGLAAVSEGLVPWYLGSEFLACAEFIQLMSPLIVFMTVNNVLRMQYFIPNKLDKIYTISIVGAAVINLTINLVLVKPIGIYGVIVGTIVSEFLAMCYLMYKSYHGLNYKRMVKPFLYGIVSLIAMYWVLTHISKKLRASFISTVIEILVGVSVYMVFYGGLSTIFRKKDLMG